MMTLILMELVFAFAVASLFAADMVNRGRPHLGE